MRLVEGLLVVVVTLGVGIACTNQGAKTIEKAPAGPAGGAETKQKIIIDDGYDNHDFESEKGDQDTREQGSVGGDRSGQDDRQNDSTDQDSGQNNGQDDDRDNNGSGDEFGQERDGDVVIFRIKEGTGRGAWNSESDAIRLKVGQTVRVINEDSVTHQLHTNGAPCPHGNRIQPGGTYECRATRAYNGRPLYDHISGGAVYIRADQ